MEPKAFVEEMADHGPAIWYGSVDFVGRLDHPEYTSYLATLNMRDLRIVQALLKCATDHINAAIEAERNV